MSKRKYSHDETQTELPLRFVVTFMANTMIYCVFLNMDDFHPSPTICFLVTMLIEGSSHSSPFACFWRTKSNIQKTFSCCVETTNAQPSIVFTDFMTNASAGTIFVFGRPLPIASTVSQLLPLLMRRFFACTGDSHQIWKQWNKSVVLYDPQMSRTRACCVICFGRIQKKRSEDGEKTTEECLIHSDRTSWHRFWSVTTWISSAEHIKLWKMDTSFLLKDNWWHYLVLQIIAVNLTMLVQWWYVSCVLYCSSPPRFHSNKNFLLCFYIYNRVLMKLWCAHFKSWNPQMNR